MTEACVDVLSLTLVSGVLHVSIISLYSRVTIDSVSRL